MEMYDYIYADGNEYEQPMVDIIMGNWWKAKADIIHKDFVIDLKTTAPILTNFSTAVAHIIMTAKLTSIKECLESLCCFL